MPGYNSFKGNAFKKRRKVDNISQKQSLNALQADEIGGLENVERDAIERDADRFFDSMTKIKMQLQKLPDAESSNRDKILREALKERNRIFGERVLQGNKLLRAAEEKGKATRSPSPTSVMGFVKPPKPEHEETSKPAAEPKGWVAWMLGR